MEPSKKTARTAGALYLFVVITGPILLIYIPNKLFVAGDATATTQNILAHETLFRLNILLGIFSNLAFMGAVLYLYKLLRHVGQDLAVAMVLLIFTVMPLSFFGSANEFAVLKLLKEGGLSPVFNQPHVNALLMLPLTLDNKQTLVWEMFWGLWLLPLGLLVYRSGFIAKFIGVWLLLNGIAYMALSFTGILLPDYVPLLDKMTTPALFGEVVLMLWLLIVGVRPARTTV